MLHTVCNDLTSEENPDAFQFTSVVQMFAVLCNGVSYVLGSRDGAVVRALASHQCGQRSIPARCHMWVEFVVGSRRPPRNFLRALGFSSLLKNQP